MKLCKTCKWWETGGYDEHNEIMSPIDEDTYEPKEMPFSVRKCHSPKVLFFERPVTDTHIALMDGSMYFAKMITAESFGCVNHEGKETKEYTDSGWQKDSKHEFPAKLLHYLTKNS